MSRTVRAAHGFATSIMRSLSQILVQVFLSPIVLKVAGRETLGAFAAIMQVVGLLALVDIVGTWSLERFLGQAVGLDDGGKHFRDIFTTARTVFVFINVAFAALVFIFSFFIPRMFHLSPAVAHQARYALYVIAVWSVLRTPLAAYANASTATQDMAMMNVISTVLGVARAVASLAFVLAGGGLFGLMLAGTFTEACGYILFRMRFKKVNPNLMPGWGIRDSRLLKEMLGFGYHATLINLGNSLVFSSGATIAGMTSGAAMASSFYTTQMPATTALNMTQSLSESATPAINELWGRKEVEKVRSTLRRIIRLILALTLPLAVGVLLFNRDLVVTWVGSGQYGGTLLTVSLAAFCIVVSLNRVVVVFSFVLGWLQFLTTTTLLQGAANFALAYYFSKRFGIGGITLALVVVILPQTVVLWYRVGQFLNVNVAALMGECAARTVLPLVSAAVAGLGVQHFVTIRQHHFIGLAAEMSAFLAAYSLTAYRLVLLTQDREQIKSYVIRLM